MEGGGGAAGGRPGGKRAAAPPLVILAVLRDGVFLACSPRVPTSSRARVERGRLNREGTAIARLCEEGSVRSTLARNTKLTPTRPARHHWRAQQLRERGRDGRREAGRPYQR